LLETLFRDSNPRFTPISES